MYARNQATARENYSVLLILPNMFVSPGSFQDHSTNKGKKGDIWCINYNFISVLHGATFSTLVLQLTAGYDSPISCDM